MAQSAQSSPKRQRTRLALFGVTGYTGLELIEILLRHPQVELTYLASRREELPVVSDIFPRLRGRLDVRTGAIDLDAVAQSAEVAILALPHVVSKDYVPGLLQRGLTVIDLSADYRLKDPSVYERYYGEPHTDTDNLAHAVYGLPEVYGDELPGAKLVAVPGCYPTAAILAAAPLLSTEGGQAGQSRGTRGLSPLSCSVVGEITVDAKTGISGAGRSPSLGFHFPECNESVKPYNVGVHRHQPEMEQVLSDLAGRAVSVDFVPHMVPMDRGILATVYLELEGEPTEEELLARYREFYDGQPFVRVRPLGEYPATKDVAHTNFCDIGLKVLRSGEPSRDGKTTRGELSRTRVVVMSAIDNLLKGASGQAVEDLNLVLDFPRTAGLL